MREPIQGRGVRSVLTLLGCAIAAAGLSVALLFIGLVLEPPLPVSVLLVIACATTVGFLGGAPLGTLGWIIGATVTLWLAGGYIDVRSFVEANAWLLVTYLAAAIGGIARGRWRARRRTEPAA